MLIMRPNYVSAKKNTYFFSHWHNYALSFWWRLAYEMFLIFYFRVDLCTVEILFAEDVFESGTIEGHTCHSTPPCSTSSPSSLTSDECLTMFHSPTPWC